MNIDIIFLSDTGVSNASFCSNKIYWTSPPCSASCSIIVNGQLQDDAIVSCDKEQFVTSFSYLAFKTVEITATLETGFSVTTGKSICELHVPQINIC